MTLKIQIIAINTLLTLLYKEAMSLSTLLKGLDFDNGQIELLRSQHIETVAEGYIGLLKERFNQISDGERLYEILVRRYGLDGSEPDTLQNLGEKHHVSRERIRQLQDKAVLRCKNKRWREAWELGLKRIALDCLRKTYDYSNTCQQGSEYPVQSFELRENQEFPYVPKEENAVAQSHKEAMSLTGSVKQKELDSRGYIYLLSNVAMPGLCKISKCNNSPENRALELSKHTGIPFPFKVAYKRNTILNHHAEIIIHSQLWPYRVDLLKEFYRVDQKQAQETCDSVLAMLYDDHDLLSRMFPRLGLEWTEQESEALKQEYRTNADFKVLSEAMGRTPYEIEAFLNSIGFIQTTMYPRAVPHFKGFRFRSGVVNEKRSNG